MSATTDIIEGLAKLTPRQVAAVAEVVKAMGEASEPNGAEAGQRPRTPLELLGKYDDGSCQLTIEDFRANRVAMTAEVEAKWAEREREGWL